MKNTFATILATSLLVLPVLFFMRAPATAHALTVPSTKLENPIKYNNFSDFVAAITQTAVKVLLPFVVLAFIYAGFLFVKAQGNEKELENAKKAIIWSSVGALILFGAWGFAEIIKTTIETVTN